MLKQRYDDGVVGQQRLRPDQHAVEPVHREQLPTELVPRLPVLLVCAPRHRDDLGIGAGLVDRPPEMVDAIERHRLDAATGDLLRQPLRRGVVEHHKARLRLVRGPWAHPAEAPAPTVLWPAPMLVSDACPHVREEVLGMVCGIPQMVQGLRHGLRARLRHAMHQDTHTAPINGLRNTLASRIWFPHPIVEVKERDELAETTYEVGLRN
mmetsp:Transcript_10892/g.31020  ORF Transcript_10892/g.31020 Transcript_10892/m.31020 type:complete len:209 (-) Transcript_10892:122-748(-)